MRAPNECTPVDRSPKYEAIESEVSVAVHNMQFGDMIWMAVQRGSQERVAELIAGLIYNNLDRWSLTEKV